MLGPETARFFITKLIGQNAEMGMPAGRNIGKFGKIGVR